MITYPQHLAEHRWASIYQGCECQRPWDTPPAEPMDQDDHDRHVAATWRQTRTVRTADDLAELPDGSIYISDSHSLAEQKIVSVWFAAGCAEPFEPSLPGVVIHRPDLDDLTDDE
ncbi:hypothetical protein [Gordonia aichiensis]|uniref:hypothetical protein n=1 Tax=Gordonia aichiensis TaxID=36820 RepID=UPI003267A1A2